MSDMSDLKQIFSDWGWYEMLGGDMPQSEWEELLNVIRSDWVDLEKRDYWIVRAREGARNAAELREKSRGITDRIKNRIEREKSE